MPSPRPARVRPYIREAAPQDLSWIAHLHNLQLPHGFFARLGPRYLRAYHRSFIDSPHAVALVAENHGEPIGFIVGAIHAGNHRSFVIRTYGLKLAVAGTMALASRPALALEFMRTRVLRYLRGLQRSMRSSTGGTASEPGSGGLDCAVLTHVAVDPSAERAGIGRTLVDSFVAAVNNRRAKRIELVTLIDERGAADFYAHLGWQAAGESGASGARFRRFVLELR